MLYLNDFMSSSGDIVSSKRVELYVGMDESKRSVFSEMLQSFLAEDMDRYGDASKDVNDFVSAVKNVVDDKPNVPMDQIRRGVVKSLCYGSRGTKIGCINVLAVMDEMCS